MTLNRLLLGTLALLINLSVTGATAQAAEYDDVILMDNRKPMVIMPHDLNPPGKSPIPKSESPAESQSS